MVGQLLLESAEGLLADHEYIDAFPLYPGEDPVEQIQMQERRYEVHDGDQITEEEVHAGQTRWYHRNEVLWMLQLAGFADDDMDLWPNHQFDMTPKGWKQWQNQQM